jgi:transketolase C-terminal domain/subunit
LSKKASADAVVTPACRQAAFLLQDSFIITQNSTLESCGFQAEKELKKQGVNAMVIDMHTLKPFDEELVLKAA